MTEMEISVTPDGQFILMEFTANESLKFSVLMSAQEGDTMRAGLVTALRMMHYERPS